MTHKTSPETRSPLTAAGMESYKGLLAAYDINVTGTLPKGDTTRTVTHFIKDTANDYNSWSRYTSRRCTEEQFRFNDSESSERQHVVGDRHFRRRWLSSNDFSERRHSH